MYSYTVHYGFKVTQTSVIYLNSFASHELSASVGVMGIYFFSLLAIDELYFCDLCRSVNMIHLCNAVIIAAT